MTNSNENREKPNGKLEKESKLMRNFMLFVPLSVAALIIAESALLAFPDLPVWVKIVIALAHVPFTILVAVYGWRVLKGLDELQRLIHMQAFIIGITISGAILLSYSLLTFVGLVSGEMTWMFWALLWIFYSLGYAYVAKKMS